MKKSIFYSVFVFVLMMAFSQTLSAQSFTLANGKLGPVQVGKAIGKLPPRVAGLYDKYSLKKEEHEDMDGAWTEEYYQFVKAGKTIFKVYLEEGKVSAISLLPGSSFIKTPDGFYVGYPAQKLYQQKKMQWEYYLSEPEAFATSGHYTYGVAATDVKTNSMDKLIGFKPNAKVSIITYR